MWFSCCYSCKPADGRFPNSRWRAVGSSAVFAKIVAVQSTDPIFAGIFAGTRLKTACPPLKFPRISREFKLAPEEGLEPSTSRLTAARSTIELLWNQTDAQFTGRRAFVKPIPQLFWQCGQ
jgi:hypothetical protein